MLIMSVTNAESSCIYLDYNATTPLEEEVLQSINSALREAWGNPSSNHEGGKKAKHLIDESRSKVAQMIGADPSEIIFTSGGTESNNLIIYSAVEYFKIFLDKINSENFNYRNIDRPHVITTNIEHDSIKIPLEILTKKGILEATFVPVSKCAGQIIIEDIIKEIKPETCLITVMMANNETGIVQPISSLSCRIARLNNRRTHIENLPPVLFHTDAAQTIGKVEVDVSILAVDYLTIVGHKFYGPRTGALYFRNKKQYSQILFPIFYGGGQERNYRPGTENTGMIVGLGKAAELVSENLNQYNKSMEEVRNYLESQLQKTFKDKVYFNNIRDSVPRLPNTASVAFRYENISGAMILSKATRVCASTAAACHKDVKLSSVLLSSGVEEHLAKTTLRLSVGRHTRKCDIDIAVADLYQAISELCN